MEVLWGMNNSHADFSILFYNNDPFWAISTEMGQFYENLECI